MPDLRNSRVIDIINALQARGLDVDVHDCFADPEKARSEYGVNLLPSLDKASGYNCVVGAVSHQQYAGFRPEDFARLLTDEAVIADVKGMWRTIHLPKEYRRWNL